MKWWKCASAVWTCLKIYDGSWILNCASRLTLQKIEDARPCPMCQTLHQLSDMVESKNKEGKLEFFCSNRCMMVHKAQSVTAPGTGTSLTLQLSLLPLFLFFKYEITEQCLSVDSRWIYRLHLAAQLLCLANQDDTKTNTLLECSVSMFVSCVYRKEQPNTGWDWR